MTRRYSQTIRRLAVVLTAVLWCGSRLSAAPAEVSREPQLKAVCLVRFAQFVEWPATAFASPVSPIVIGVLGEDTFNGNLEAAVRQVGPVRNRPFAVEHYRRVEEIQSCHILFISASEDPRLEKILPALGGRSILTVGETEGFVLRGGMIRFLTVENKLRFRVNLAQARSANLQLSSKLLQWAEVIKTDSQRSAWHGGRHQYASNYYWSSWGPARWCWRSRRRR